MFNKAHARAAQRGLIFNLFFDLLIKRYSFKGKIKLLKLHLTYFEFCRPKHLETKFGVRGGGAVQKVGGGGGGGEGRGGRRLG